MDKASLVDRVARDAGISRKEADKVLNAVVGTITRSLKRGESVTLRGLGSFSVERRPGGRIENPRTGIPIRVRQRKALKFTAAKTLKQAVRK